MNKKKKKQRYASVSDVKKNILLICISPVAKDTFFMYVLAVCTSFENSLSICPIIDWIICSFGVQFFSSFFILDINPLAIFFLIL
jgi:hypothetical protein